MAAVLVLACAGGGAVALTRHELGHAPPTHHVDAGRSPAEPSVVPGRTISLDPTTRAGLTFLPLGPQPDDGRTLSAQHAYDALLQTPSKLNPIPATVQAYYGSLTDAGTSPMAVDMRVWGFAVVRGCVVTGGASLPGAPTAPPTPMQCRQWEFVNARTGHALGVIEQEVLPD